MKERQNKELQEGQKARSWCLKTDGESEEISVQSQSCIQMTRQQQEGMNSFKVIPMGQVISRPIKGALVTIVIVLNIRNVSGNNEI